MLAHSLLILYKLGIDELQFLLDSKFLRILADQAYSLLNLTVLHENIFLLGILVNAKMDLSHFG